MSEKRNHIFPVEKAGSLDSRIRGWFFNPKKILGPYVKEGTTALDIGCGPGFFTVPLAQMAGTTGHVVAADLQEEMLRKVHMKIKGTCLEKRVTLHKCEEDGIHFSEMVDFILLFYVVHEVSAKEALFRELQSVLKVNGRMLVAEPPFRVSKKEFEKTIRKAGDAGFVVVERPGIFPNYVAVLKRNS